MTFPVADWALMEARVDYWSGTTEDRDIGQWAYERTRDYIENDRLGGYAHSGANIQGYAGVASDHSFAGQREDGTFVRFSSIDASDRWAEFVGAGLRTSRIDLCVTCRASRDVPDVAYSIRYDPGLPVRVRGQRPRLVLLSDSASGDTAYVGGPRSARRGRVYDKAREEPANYPVGAWRWEVQSRHQFGDAIAGHLATRERPTEWITTYVKDWFNDRGVEAPWRTEKRASLPKVPASTTTDATRLEWLKTSVRPMVERLKVRYTVRELRAALGLQYRT
jgi:hypothetical protein